MATESGRTDSPLVKLLLDEPYRFDFFQAVRLLERIYNERVPAGYDVEPQREVARFRTSVTLRFPPSQIQQISRDKSGETPPEVTVAFMGMTGPLGVLPHPYTELLIERTRYGDTALWAFLDLFNHRLISLFYRAWEKYNFPFAYERDQQDRFTEYLLDVVGFGTRGLRGRTTFPDRALIYYGGLVAQRPHSSAAIRSIVSDYFEVDAEVEQFSGQWLKLDDESVTKLGAANSRLGVDAVAGASVWDNQSKFRVRMGPLKFKEFFEFLPAGSAFEPASDVIRLLSGAELDFDLQLILKAREVPACILTTRARRKPMVGWTTWLKTRPFTTDDRQVVLQARN
ncbi:MAG TPA: type VI secretion system baseplate subunit TssG [Blastocatellia bacterium]|nr:type VI secretion system baseplate subunit TssG [Blastocatellia bacterium]